MFTLQPPAGTTQQIRSANNHELMMTQHFSSGSFFLKSAGFYVNTFNKCEFSVLLSQQLQVVQLLHDGTKS